MACSPKTCFLALWMCLRFAALTMSSALLGTAARGQAPFPPLAASQATSAQAALAALAVPQAEPSSYVLLDIPEVAAPGKIKGRIGSEYPGTSMLLLLRTGPELSTAVPAPVHKKAGSKGSVTPPGPASPQPMPSLIMARKIAPGESALVNVEFEITRTQRYAVYAFAQGRWFIAEREVKVGQDGSHR